MKTETIQKNNSITGILKVFTGCSLALIFFLMVANVYYNFFYFKTIYTTDKLVLDGYSTYEYPYDFEIICEEGIYIGEYKNSKKKIIYTCLGSLGCNTSGKVCLIKTKERVIK